MLVQKLCKTLKLKIPRFFSALTNYVDRIGTCIKNQQVSCYLESENMDALISVCTSALQRGYLIISQHRQNFSPGGFVFQNRLNIDGQGRNCPAARA